MKQQRQQVQEAGGISSGILLIFLGWLLNRWGWIDNEASNVFFAFGVSFILIGLSPFFAQVGLKRYGQASLALGVIGLVVGLALGYNAVVR